jgi:protein-tyrosine phosphatase
MLSDAIEIYKILSDKNNDDNISQKIKELSEKINNKQKYVNIGLLMHINPVIQEVYPNVWIGSENGARNLKEIKKNNITHVLNITIEANNFFPDLLQYFNIRIADAIDVDILESGILEQCLNIIDETLQNNGRILVHCQAGMSRSGSIVIAFLMKHKKISYERALSHAVSIRNCIMPNISFEKQIKKYFEKKTDNSNIISIFNVDFLRQKMYL